MIAATDQFMRDAGRGSERLRGSPLVSVVIPSYNRGDLIGQTLDSLLAQTYANWEAVVVDDHSTDASAAVLEKRSATEPRIRWWLRKSAKAGAPACRNEGFRASRGEFVIFLDSDDLLEPTCLEHRVAVMQAHPSAGYAVFPSAVFRDRPWDTGIFWNAFDDGNDLDRFLLADIPWQTTGPIWRREAVEAVGPWDEEAKRWQDWEFHVRALARRIPYVKVPLPDCHWRQSRVGSISDSEMKPQAFDSHDVIMPKVAKALDQAGLLKGDRRQMLAALMLFTAQQCALLGRDRERALNLWRAARRAKLCNAAAYAAGRTYLRRLGTPTGGRIRRWILPPLLPYLGRVADSPTRCSTRSPLVGSVPLSILPASAAVVTPN